MSLNLTLITRLESHLNRASLSQIDTGMQWYENANKQAQKLSKEHGYPVAVVSGVISALSPSVQWERNLIDAHNILRNEESRVSTYPAHKGKALEIMAPWNDEDYIYSILLGNRGRGKKTASFFDNILNYETSTRVTVDRWMYRACGLDANVKYYDEIQDAVRMIAVSEGILPHQVQAIVWEVMRGEV